MRCMMKEKQDEDEMRKERYENLTMEKEGDVMEDEDDWV